MANAIRKKAKIGTMMKSAAFRAGYEEIKACKSFDPEKFSGDPKAQWRYERGRMCGVIAKASAGYIPNLKNGRELNFEAIRILNPSLKDVFGF